MFPLSGAVAVTSRAGESAAAAVAAAGLIAAIHSGARGFSAMALARRVAERGEKTGISTGV